MPWIELEGAVNVRDLGGLPAGNGDRTVAPAAARRQPPGTDAVRHRPARAGHRRDHHRGPAQYRPSSTSEGPAPLDAVAGVRHAHHPVLPELGATTDAVADVLLTRGRPGPVPVPERSGGRALPGLPGGPARPGRGRAAQYRHLGRARRWCTAPRARTAPAWWWRVALTAVGVPAEVVVADYAATGERTEQIVDRLRRSPTYADDINSKDARSAPGRGRRPWRHSWTR